MAIIGSLPAQITAGQPVTAAPVMADLNWIVSQVNSNAQPVGTVPSTTQWQPLNLTPTYINPTQFSVPSDVTAILFPSGAQGAKLQTTNTAGLVYSYVTAVTVSAGVSTLTLFNLVGVLDAGLSAVSYGIISAFPFKNALPQPSILQVLWAHGSDAISTASAKIVCTNNNFTLTALNYGGSTGNFASPGEYSTATGQFIPTRTGFYQVNQWIQINTSGVTFSGGCAIGSVTGTNLSSPAVPDFCTSLVANRASAVNSYVEYGISGGAPINLGLLLTFSAGTPVFVQGALTIIGPL